MEDLQGKVAVVTGASLGIGAAIAKALAREGCKVALIARGQEGLKNVALEITAQGGNAHPYPCDMNDADAFEATARKVEEELGPIAVLVNNAGAGTFKPLDQMGRDEALLTVNLPFGAAVAACHAVVPGMKARREGHIVNLTSPAGYLPLPYMTPYTGSRHAMVGFSHGLHEELERHGVGVTILCPAQVNTGYFERNDADMRWYPRVRKILPVLEPEEVGAQTLLAIRENKREHIFPSRLRVLIELYRRTPVSSLWLMKKLRLWQPSRKA